MKCVVKNGYGVYGRRFDILASDEERGFSINGRRRRRKRTYVFFKNNFCIMKFPNVERTA